MIFLGGGIIATFFALEDTPQKQNDMVQLVAEEKIAELEVYWPPEVTAIPMPDEIDISLYQEPVTTLEPVTVRAGGQYIFPTPHTPEMNWDEFMLSILTADYTFGEVSENVRMLQFFVGSNQDGVYGPATYNAHNKALYPFFGTLESGNYLPTWISGGVTFVEDVERWRSISLDALSLYGQEHQIDRFLRVMQCESRGLPDAFNESSGASGLMQHLANYWPWRAKMAGFEGVSPFDATANIYTSAWLLFEHSAGGWQHWECK